LRAAGGLSGLSRRVGELLSAGWRVGVKNEAGVVRKSLSVTSYRGRPLVRTGEKPSTSDQLGTICLHIGG
jgi:hypothetical protein